MAGIGDLARDAGVPSVKVRALFDALVNRVKTGQVVSIQGLGNFRVTDRKATKARNPQTGEQFDVPETKRLKFQASRTLKDKLNPHMIKDVPPKAEEATIEQVEKAPQAVD